MPDQVDLEKDEVVEATQPEALKLPAAPVEAAVKTPTLEVRAAVAGAKVASEEAVVPQKPAEAAKIDDKRAEFFEYLEQWGTKQNSSRCAGAKVYREQFGLAEHEAGQLFIEFLTEQASKKSIQWLWYMLMSMKDIKIEENESNLTEGFNKYMYRRGERGVIAQMHISILKRLLQEPKIDESSERILSIFFHHDYRAELKYRIPFIKGRYLRKKIEQTLKELEGAQVS